jgi:hypothetical protein
MNRRSGRVILGIALLVTGYAVTTALPSVPASSTGEQNPASRQAPGDAGASSGEAPGAVTIVAQGPARTSEEVLESAQSFAEFYRNRETAARKGDADSSYVLFNVLQQCEFGVAIQNAAESLAVEAPESTYLSLAERAIMTERQLDSVCSQVSGEVARQRIDWLRMAARGGNVDAKLQFYIYAFEDFSSPSDLVERAEEVAELRRESLQHLIDAAAVGRQQALSTLASHYERGGLTNPDPMRAYVHARVLEMMGSQTASNDVARLGASLSAQEISSAEDQALDLFRRCCEAERPLADRSEAMDPADAQTELAEATAQLQVLERLRKNLKSFSQFAGSSGFLNFAERFA